MNYRHSYHAGSFTDIVKHIVLIALVQALSKKDKPFCLLDTHAGRGLYDLHSIEASKTLEYQTGIDKLNSFLSPPPLLQQLLSCIQHFNPNGSQRFYPGSPLIAQYFMRPQDRLIACELHPEEFQLLKSNCSYFPNMQLHQRDAYQGVKAFLPPKEKRGLVFIDPPYEKTNEFEMICQNLEEGLKRFSNGIYTVWYPIKDIHEINKFYRNLKQKIPQEKIVTEFTIQPNVPQRLSGCGLLTINPPWQLKETLDSNLPKIWNTLSINNKGYYHTKFLNKD